MKNPDKLRYSNYLTAASEDFEARCKRCGACCGALDDPCHNLVKTPAGSWKCKNYENRFGLQRTVSGVTFNCVSIREHISRGTLRPGCGYHKMGIR